MHLVVSSVLAIISGLERQWNRSCRNQYVEYNKHAVFKILQPLCESVPSYKKDPVKYIHITVYSPIGKPQDCCQLACRLLRWGFQKLDRRLSWDGKVLCNIIMRFLCTIAILCQCPICLHKRAGADVNAPCRLKTSRSTPLHLACTSGDVDIVQILLSTGQINAYVRNAHYANVLHKAAEYKRLDVARLILKHW